MKFKYAGDEWYIDGYLANALNSLVYNIKKDWDFIIMITGDRGVRVGKSILAMTIAAYLGKLLADLKMNNNAFGINDIYFDSVAMMDAAFKKAKYSINLYDEGRESLASSKAMKGLQQDILDFFAECGQLNQLFIIVAPDFFKLSEEIAVARSEFLINVYRRETIKEIDFFKNGTKVPIVKLDRGYFEFFSRKKKQNLYDKSRSTKRKNYGLIKADFTGRFINQYPVGEEEYKVKKRAALARFTEKKEQEKNKAVDSKIKDWHKIFLLLTEEYGKKQLCEYSLVLGRSKEYLYRKRRRILEDNASEKIRKGYELQKTFTLPRQVG